ncbi:MAG: hypothetical protein ATN35_10585 [Epulopiscium sp. Nele67-Bin004]|nr:MAG: hypothetical protein ATN35_10585 [Epulopiscium sp. Nele67-Bin004]
MPHLTTSYKKNTSAWASFVLGVVSSLAWLIPIVGLPVSIVGTVLGALGMKNKRSKGISIAGFVINLVFLIITIVKLTVDIVMHFKGQSELAE